MHRLAHFAHSFVGRMKFKLKSRSRERNAFVLVSRNYGCGSGRFLCRFHRFRFRSHYIDQIQVAISSSELEAVNPKYEHIHSVFFLVFRRWRVSNRCRRTLRKWTPSSPKSWRNWICRRRSDSKCSRCLWKRNGNFTAVGKRLKLRWRNVME